MTEVWRPIPGYRGRYEASDKGRIKSLLGSAPRILRPQRHADGYRPITLRHPRHGRKTYTVHKLVILAFRGPIRAGLEIAHLNGDPADNRLENLAVVTHAENERHKREHGTLTVMAGERNGNAKLTAAEVAEIRRLSRAGLPQTAIAAVFGVGQGSVSKIVNGQMWRCDYAKESR